MTLAAPRRPIAPRAARVVVTVLVVIAVVIAFLLPYLWILASSFKDQSSIFSDVAPLSWRRLWDEGWCLVKCIDFI
jgi:multiple sugar transport system permease protein/putative chitobiose transport system permease protein